MKNADVHGRIASKKASGPRPDKFQTIPTFALSCSSLAERGISVGRLAKKAAKVDRLQTIYAHAIDDVLTKPEASRLGERIYMYKDDTWHSVSWGMREGALEDGEELCDRLEAISQDLWHAEHWLHSLAAITRQQAETAVAAIHQLISIANLVTESLPPGKMEEEIEKQNGWFEWMRACLVYFMNRAQDDEARDEPEPVRRSRKTSTRRAPLTPQQRRAVYDKTDGICWYCGKQTDAILNFHVDHVHPVALGGSNDPENLVPCCRDCNALNRAKPLDAFRVARGGGLFWFERREAR